MSNSKNKHRVIVVEDDRTSRAIITRILEKAGYDVLEFGEGRDALHFASMNAPRAMIIDVMLPDMQGTAIAEEISAKLNSRFTKCIFLTGLLTGKSDQKKYFFDIEGKRYRALPKPVRKSRLLNLLDDAISASIEDERNAEAAQASLEASKEVERLAKIQKKKVAIEEEVETDQSLSL
ncbi:response regulator [Pelagicoccus albus]|uniref:Response regulator n=1 Tax=Pelagicoccus albus TaxID=415222 RepID=A0A7X1B6J7_9BACT|nr:response regulator [Pelagicoccus albus]MBC2605310.1 response regulator [Pelagicoccus albus]